MPSSQTSSPAFDLDPAFALSRDSSGNGKVGEIPGLTSGAWFDHSPSGMS
jgi:hypothetical protein